MSRKIKLSIAAVGLSLLLSNASMAMPGRDGGGNHKKECSHKSHSQKPSKEVRQQIKKILDANKVQMKQLHKELKRLNKQLNKKISNKKSSLNEVLELTKKINQVTNKIAIKKSTIRYNVFQKTNFLMHNKMKRHH